MIPPVSRVNHLQDHAEFRTNLRALRQPQQQTPKNGALSRDQVTLRRGRTRPRTLINSSSTS